MPLLQQLIISGHLSYDLPDNSDTHGSIGLRVSSVVHSKKDDLAQYMIKHCDTLEVIDIESKDTSFVLATVQQQAPSTFKRLCEIWYPSDIDRCHMPVTLWIIRHAPQYWREDHINWCLPLEAISCISITLL